MHWRPWLLRHRDELFAVVAFVGLTGELLAWDDARLAAALPLAAATGVAVYWRRTQPVPSFIAAWLALTTITRFAPDFDNGSSTFVVIYFVTLFSLGAHTRGFEVAVAAALVVAGIGVFVYTDGDTFAVGDVIFAIVFVGGPWATGLALRLRGDLARSNATLKHEQEERELRAVTAERARIARELHDVVSHAISVTVLQARGARRTLGVDEEQVRVALEAIEQTNTAALSDMRRLLAVLRDTEPTGDEHRDPAPLPTLANLDQLVARVSASGLPVTFDVVGRAESVPPGVDLSAYRIVQEALTNVLKHSTGATARVTLTYDDDALGVTVTDDGTTYATRSDTGQGLIGIRERVAVVGGEVTAEALTEGGFQVNARLPYSLETL